MSKILDAPAERHETFRKGIIHALEGNTLSAKELSGLLRTSEKEVYGHLDHIRRTLERGPRKLVIHPAQCKKCGFVFKKRERMKKPGRCPLCRGESIEPPLFSIR